MKNLFTFILLSVILLSSCAKKELTLNIDIKSDKIDQLILTNIIEGIYDTISVIELNSYVVNNVKRPQVITISSSRLRHNIFVVPGSNISITDNEKGNELVISGDQIVNQKLLEEFEKEFEIAESKFGPNKIMKYDPEEFVSKLNLKYAKPLEILTSAIQDGNVNVNLTQWLSNRIQAGIAQSKIFYPQYYEYVNKKEAKLPLDYYAFIEDFDFENEEMFYFNDVRRTGESIIGHTFDYQEMASISDYYAAQYYAVTDYTSNPKLIEYYKYKLIVDKINFAGGLDGMEEEINAFLETITSPQRKNDLQLLVMQWEPLKKGLDAPNFTAYARDGEEVQLADLEGKSVYIDVWATWCGPCIAEIPSLNELEEKYHDENIEFVSVSIDKESDREKWLKFIDDKSLSGTQIMAKNDWNSEITSRYNIKGIPRFILIDSKGKIVSADAPRPSSLKSIEGMLADILD